MPKSWRRTLCCLTGAVLCLSLTAQAAEPTQDTQVPEEETAQMETPTQEPQTAPEEGDQTGDTQTVPEEDEAPVAYGDVSEGDWFYPALNWCEQAGLLRDIPLLGVFGSEQTVTRAMFTTMLARLLEPNLAWEEAPVYTDVQPGSYYYQAVSWAGAQHLVSGYGDGSFHPGELLTRQQMAVLLASAARYLGYDATPTTSVPFAACPDARLVGSWARKDVKWCLQEGILTGTADGRISPQTHLTRGQTVQVLQRFGQWLASPDAGPKVSTVPLSAVVENTAIHAAVQAKVNQIAAKYGADGLSVAYVRDGQVVDTYAYGAAVKGVRGMTANTKLRVASISKVMVGLAAQLAARDGTFDLDGDIGDYLGVNIRTHRAGDVVTPRSILSHTSSLTVAPEGTPCDLASVRQRLASSIATRNVISGNLGNWAYNNYAFSVLGLAVERAEGRTLDEILYESLYGPLHIDAAFYTGDINGTSSLAEIYRSNGAVGLSLASQVQRKSDGLPGTDGITFAGGLTISAYDLGKIVALLANDGVYDGVQYIPPEVVSALESHQNGMIAGGFYQGQPLRYRNWAYGQSQLYYHTGSAYGVYNLISYNPTTKSGVVVLTSGASATKDAYGIYAVCGEISRMLYEADPQ